MPFFYVRSNHFIAMFHLSEEGEPMAFLNPSKNLISYIKESTLTILFYPMFLESGISYTVIHINNEDLKEEEKTGIDPESESEEEEDLDLADLLNNL